jgi:hypothetical protein
MLTPVGTAVATARGTYPLADGRHRVVLAGERFTVFEGLTKARWFTVLPPDAPAPAGNAPAAAPEEPVALSQVAAVERKRRAAVKAPTADDIV